MPHTEEREPLERRVSRKVPGSLAAPSPGATPAPAGWEALAEPGKLIMLDGTRPHLRRAMQELAYFAAHARDGAVLWLDGEHGFNPYDLAELNMARGFPGEWGADRVLIKRCMTPFQWDTVLTKHLEAKLCAEDASLVIVSPYDALFSTDELKDWEKQDYVAFSARHLKWLAGEHGVPIVLSVDMARWWTAFPALARAAYGACGARWTVEPSGAGWTAVEWGSARRAGSPGVARQPSLRDFDGPARWRRPQVPAVEPAADAQLVVVRRPEPLASA